jgi:hypothetical protein
MMTKKVRQIESYGVDIRITPIIKDKTNRASKTENPYARSELNTVWLTKSVTIVKGSKIKSSILRSVGVFHCGSSDSDSLNFHGWGTYVHTDQALRMSSTHGLVMKRFRIEFSLMISQTSIFDAYSRDFFVLINTRPSTGHNLRCKRYCTTYSIFRYQDYQYHQAISNFYPIDCMNSWVDFA